MKKLLLLALLAFHCIGAFAQTPTLAIYSKLYADDAQVSLNPLVAELTGRLMDNYTLVSRMEEFQALVDKELTYQASGRVDDEMLVKLGKEFGADNVCAVFVEYNKASNAYFYWVKVISTQNRDIKRNGQSTASDLSISKQQFAAKEILEQLFPPVPVKLNLLYNEGVNVFHGSYCYDEEQVNRLLRECDDKRAVKLYSSGLKQKKTARWLYGGGGVVLFVGAMCHIGWKDVENIYEYRTVEVPEKHLGSGIVIGAHTTKEKVLIKSTRWHKTTKTAVAFTVIGTSTLIIGGILSKLADNNVGAAITIYNNELKRGNAYSFQCSFGPTPSGVGLCLKF